MAIDDETRYYQLETGARYLATQAGPGDDRLRHLGMAEKYAQKRAAAAIWGKD